MTHTVLRIILSLVLLFSLPSVAALVVLVAESTRWFQNWLWGMVLLVLVIVMGVGGWIAVWARQVRWTWVRIVLTIVAVPASAIPVAGLGGIVALAAWLAPANNPYGFNPLSAVGVVLGPFLWYLSWLVCAALVWRQTRGEREAKVGRTWCPRCRYDLRGRYEANCPECGAVYTVDELYALLAYDRRRTGVGD